MNEAVCLEGVGKKYRFWGYHAFTVRDEFALLVNRLNPWRKRKINTPEEEDRTSFWALRDINLCVEKGEALGIIGSNGAGKTTILKLMSGIIYPTKGRITTCGRLGSLIELGAGLHGDLTGRDNIFLYGSIIGMSRRELKENFDSIVDFSELGKFVNEPVKYYSSGMELRLAFSVTIHLNPDILLIDEILAVGDEKFYRKSLDAMTKFIKSGRTVIMVSHNLASVSNFCKRVVLLEKGKVAADGAAHDVILTYQSKAGQGSFTSSSEKHPKNRWGNQDIEIKNVEFVDRPAAAEPKVFESAGNWAFKVEFEAKRRIEAAVFGMAIHNEKGDLVYGETNGLDMDRPLIIEGRAGFVYKTASLGLPSGKYYLSVYIQDVNKAVVYDWLDRWCVFELADPRPVERLGQVSLAAQWEYRY